MLAHNQRGEFFKQMTEEHRKDFEEIRRTPPSSVHKEWLINKLKNEELDYPGKYI